MTGEHAYGSTWPHRPTAGTEPVAYATWRPSLPERDAAHRRRLAGALQPRRGRVGAVRARRWPSPGRPTPTQVQAVVRWCASSTGCRSCPAAPAPACPAAPTRSTARWSSASSGWTPILRIDPVERLAVVQPGVINDDLRAACAEHGLWYPPDPASSPWSTIGGNVATNAGGVCCVKYGVTGDYVLALEVVTGTGELVRVGRQTAKGVAGYDLAVAAGRLRGHARPGHRDHRPAAARAGRRSTRSSASSTRWSPPARPWPRSPGPASSRRRWSCSTGTA